MSRAATLLWSVERTSLGCTLRSAPGRGSGATDARLAARKPMSRLASTGVRRNVSTHRSSRHRLRFTKPSAGRHVARRTMARSSAAKWRNRTSPCSAAPSPTQTVSRQLLAAARARRRPRRKCRSRGASEGAPPTGRAAGGPGGAVHQLGALNFAADVGSGLVDGSPRLSLAASPRQKAAPTSAGGNGLRAACPPSLRSVLVLAPPSGRPIAPALARRGVLPPGTATTNRRSTT